MTQLFLLSGQNIRSFSFSGEEEDKMVRYNISDSMKLNLSKFWEIVKDREACGMLQSMGLEESGIT